MNMKKKWLLLLPLAVLLLVLLCAGWKYPQCTTAFATLWTLTMIGLLTYAIYKCLLVGVCKALKKSPPRSVVFRCVIVLICFSISYEALYYFSGSSLGLSVAHAARTVFSGIETAVGYEPPPREIEISPEPTVQPPEEIAQSSEKTKDIDIGTTPDSYVAIFELYEKAFQEEWDRSQLLDAEVNPLCAFYQDLSEIGYAYLDVDGNETDELLIGADNTIFDCYTLVGRKPKLVFQSGERVTYNICTDGSIACSGSDSAFSHSDCYYTLGQNGELLLLEAVMVDTEASEDICFYSTTSESIEGSAPISFEEADQIMGKYTYMAITFEPLAPSDSAPNNNNSAESVLSFDAPYLGDYRMRSEDENMGATLSLFYSLDDSQVYLEGFANFYDHAGDVYGEVRIVDSSHFYYEDSGNRLDILYDESSDTLTIKETGIFGGVGVTFEGVYEKELIGPTVTDDDSYPYLLEFAGLMCSDPSALWSEDEDERNAFLQSAKEGYDRWVAGTDYHYIVIDDTGHLAIDFDIAAAEGIVGLW